MKQIELALICLIIVSVNLSGQSKVIDLWNGKVPGAIYNENINKLLIQLTGIKIRFVTNPFLQVYPALPIIIPE